MIINNNKRLLNLYAFFNELQDDFKWNRVQYGINVLVHRPNGVLISFFKIKSASTVSRWITEWIASADKICIKTNRVFCSVRISFVAVASFVARPNGFLDPRNVSRHFGVHRGLLSDTAKPRPERRDAELREHVQIVFSVVYYTLKWASRIALRNAIHTVL